MAAAWLVCSALTRPWSSGSSACATWPTAGRPAKRQESSPLDGLQLLELEAEILFDLSPRGRILRTNAPDRAPGPRLWIAGCGTGSVIRIGAEVGDATARALVRLAEAEPPASEQGVFPAYPERYIELLGAEAPVRQTEHGLIWDIPQPPTFTLPVPLLRSGTAEGDAMVRRLMEGSMPALLVAAGFLSVDDLWPPWCMALEGGEIAAIGFTARLGERAAEIGVYTFPPFRGRGFAAAVTAGWAAHPALRGRPLFYSTSRENLSSQRVPERLKLRLVGQRFSVA